MERKTSLLDVFKKNGIVPMPTRMDEEIIPNNTKTQKKPLPAKQKKYAVTKPRSKWEYELPELDLQHLYGRVNEMIKLKNTAPTKESKSDKTNGSSRSMRLLLTQKSRTVKVG